MKNILKKLSLLICLSLSSTPALAKPLGAVATQHPLATGAAERVLLQGGNAVDAGIAAALTLAVVEPYNSGLGAGGMALVWDVKKKKAFAVDFRESAPLKAHAQLYFNQAPDASRVGPLASGVPGAIAGLSHLHQKWGRLPWSELFHEAIHYADTGFIPDSRLMARAKARRTCLMRDYDSSQVFRPLLYTQTDTSLVGDPYLPQNSLEPPQATKVPLWTQKNLANTLKTLRDQGPKAFYQGPLGQALVTNLQAKGGILSRQDLQKYQVKERKALKVNFSWGRLWSMPLPSSGGLSILRALNTLEALQKAQPDEITRLDDFIKVLGQVFKDRNQYLGDPDFIRGMPVKKWLRKSFAKKQAKALGQSKRQASDISQGEKPKIGQTTHLSVLDQEGQALSLTTTLNLSFGSCVTAGKTGILMNNQMDDFNTKPGQPNAFGLIQAESNTIAPGKRPLSSVSPSILSKDKQAILAIGSPGGPRIITSILQVLYRHFLLKQELKEAIASPRIHYQDQPKIVFLEKNIPAEIAQAIKDLGYASKRGKSWSNVQAVSYDPSKEIFKAYSDPRGIGKATVVLP